MIKRQRKGDRTPALLMLPYAVWVAFAAALNLKGLAIQKWWRRGESNPRFLDAQKICVFPNVFTHLNTIKRLDTL